MPALVVANSSAALSGDCRASPSSGRNIYPVTSGKGLGKMETHLEIDLETTLEEAR